MMTEKKKITIMQAVRQGAGKLLESGIENADYDSFSLLSAINGMDRSYYFAHGDAVVPETDYVCFCEYIERRAAHEPLQHILGKAWFFGYEFDVSPHVLIPRQDTEVLVEEALKEIADGSYVLDMCTGSGCIILSIAMQHQLGLGIGADLSKEALAVAEKNKNRLGAGQVRLVQSDLFDAFMAAPGQETSADSGNMQNAAMKFDVIVSNPPYIKTAVIPTLSEEVRLHDPMLALDGMADGLHFYRKITEQAVHFLKPGGWLMYEIGCEQAADVCALMRAQGFTALSVVKDLAGLDRVVRGRLQPDGRDLEI